jgi:sugar phosphate permease
MVTLTTKRSATAFWGWTALAILSFGFLIVMLIRTASGVTTSELGRDLALGASEQGMISSGALWGYAAMTLFAGVLADSIGPRKAVAIVSVLTIAGAFLFASAMGLPMALIGRGFIGVGTGISYVFALKIISLCLF